MHRLKMGDHWLESCAREKYLVTLADSKLNISEEYDVTEKKANAIFSCINRSSIAYRSREIIVPC